MCRSCADSHSCWERTGAVGLPCAEDRHYFAPVLRHLRLLSAFCSSSVRVPEPSGSGGTTRRLICDGALSTYSEYFDQMSPQVLLETQTVRRLVRDSNQLMKLAWTLTQGIPFLKAVPHLIFPPSSSRAHSLALALRTNNWRVGIMQRARVRHPICSFLTAIYNVKL